MSKALKHKDYLSLLAKSKQAKRRNLIIDLANADEIKAVAECILNVLLGNITLTNKQVKKLKRHKKYMRLVAQKSFPSQKKKAILKQKGGFLPTLIPLALSALGSVVPALLGK